MHNQLGKMLLKKIFMWYFLVATSLTLLQIYSDYQSRVDDLNKSLINMQKVFYQSLSNAIWNLDTAQIDSITSSISLLGIGVTITDINGESLSKKTVLLHNDNEIITRHFKVLHNNEYIANVTFYVDKSLIYESMKDNVALIIINALIKSFVLMLLLLYFSNKLITKILNETINTINKSKQNIHAKVDTHLINIVENNELKILVDSFNEMQDKLIQEKQKNKEKDKQLLEQANKDPMTNLYNRRYFNEVANTLLKIAKRKDSHLSLLMLDIDDFKKINDTYGHLCGDEVIKNVALTLLQLTRKSDVVIRFGGEEFIVILPNTDIEGAFAIAKKINFEIDKTTLLIKKNIIKFTISIGVAQNDNETDKDIYSIVSKSDNALYKAKASGKNKVIVYK